MQNLVKFFKLNFKIKCITITVTVDVIVEAYKLILSSLFKRLRRGPSTQKIVEPRFTLLSVDVV